MEDHLGGTGAKGCVLILDLAINGRFLTQRTTGVQRYAREILRALDRGLQDGAVRDVRAEILVPPHVTEVPAFAALTVRRVGRLRGHAWEQFELPQALRGRLLVGLCNTGPAVLRYQVVTIHDAAVFARPEAYSLAFRTWYRTLLRRLVRNALGILTPSQFSQLALAQYCGVDPRRIAVIAHGCEHARGVEADPGVITRHNLTRRPFILAVSSASANKNFSLIASAARILARDVDVVLAGGGDARVFNAIDVPDSLRRIGYVSDGELRALYEHALCFVHPSRYEGFGFPPMEAMACGCPVVASRTASLPEVCGDAALYCEPDDAEGLAAQMRALIDDAPLRDRLRVAGQARAARFNWRDAMMTHMEYLRTLVGAPGAAVVAPPTSLEVHR